MDLVVARDDGSGRVDQEGAIDPAVAVVGSQREAAQLDPDAVGRRGGTDGGQDGVTVFGRDVGGGAGTIAVEQAAHFGREHDRRAARVEVGDAGRQRCGIGCGVDAPLSPESCGLTTWVCLRRPDGLPTWSRGL